MGDPCGVLTVDSYTNLKVTLTDQKYSDIVVKAGGKQFKAHKFMLAAHSPVFDTMLSSNMKETIENVIQIDDFDDEVVQELLTYMYSGYSPKIERLGFKLLLAAEKYGMDELKAHCGHTLAAKLSLDTVVEYKALAVMCNAKQLQGKADQFIADNIVEVQKTSDWKNMLEKGLINFIQEKMQIIELH